MSDDSQDELTLTLIKIIKERDPPTVKQLIDLVKAKVAVSEEKILELIINLQSQGKIRLEDKPSSGSSKFTIYMKTSRAIWYWATVIIATVTTLIVFLIPENFYPWIYLRYVLGTIFVLWLPGYTLIKAIFPVQLTKNGKNLSTVLRIALSLGTSLALVPIIGLLLNYTPLGIQLTPILLCLFILTVIFATIAIIRENQAIERIM